MPRKEDLLRNFTMAVVSQKDRRATLVKDANEVQRLLLNGQIADGDIIIELTPGNFHIAERHDYIKIT